ncbi:MAG: hypothetical protein FJY97_11865, partial [candidate division Zixibacteria bacterium]|nr:hypothetical protein [candidate division Zixibacteria bacterium]
MIENMTLKNGRANWGGAILNKGTLTLTNCVLKDNKALGGNGGDGGIAGGSGGNGGDGGIGGNGFG